MLKRLIKILKTGNDEEIEQIFHLMDNFSFINCTETLLEEFNELEKHKNELKVETVDDSIVAFKNLIISQLEMRQRHIKKEMEEYINETKIIE